MEVRRCRSCGCRLARDQRDAYCSPCQAKVDDRFTRRLTQLVAGGATLNAANRIAESELPPDSSANRWQSSRRPATPELTAALERFIAELAPDGRCPGCRKIALAYMGWSVPELRGKVCWYRYDAEVGGLISSCQHVSIL